MPDLTAAVGTRRDRRGGAVDGPDRLRKRLDALKGCLDIRTGLPHPGTPSSRLLSYLLSQDKPGRLSVARRRVLAALLGDGWAERFRRVGAGETLLREWRAFVAGGESAYPKRLQTVINHVRVNFTRRGASYEMSIRRQIYGKGFPMDLLACDCRPVLWFRVYLMLRDGRPCRYRFPVSSPHNKTLRLLAGIIGSGSLDNPIRRLLCRAKFPMDMLTRLS